MITKMRGGEDRGVYSVYWEREYDESDFQSISVIFPKSDDTPNKVKLMIIQSLIDDLKIPIEIKEYMIPTGQR